MNRDIVGQGSEKLAIFVFSGRWRAVGALSGENGQNGRFRGF